MAKFPQIVVGITDLESEESLGEGVRVVNLDGFAEDVEGCGRAQVAPVHIPAQQRIYKMK